MDSPQEPRDPGVGNGRLHHSARLYFRDQLRTARAAVLRDAEAFPEILFAVERLGAFLLGRPASLGEYRGVLVELASASVLAKTIPEENQASHVPFDRLFEIVRDGRNDALHQGVVARHLASRSFDLALVLEDALMNGSDRISDFMVRSPVCAEPWQPLSVVRHNLLENSFSFLPLRPDGDASSWLLVSDGALARVLRATDSPEERKRRLSATITEAVTAFDLQLEPAFVVAESDTVGHVLTKTADRPVLVLDDQRRLMGIVTAFDLL